MKINDSNLQKLTTSKIMLTIDYTKTLEQAIAVGKYDRADSDITAKNFPIFPEMVGKKVDVFVKLFHFNRDISSGEAISEMDKGGYRPATSMELLVLGYQYPELQRQFPIVALGSVLRHASLGRYVPYLDAFDYERVLYLLWFDSVWNAHCRFLGVCK